MSVHIQFDQLESTCYTNLDFVSGTIVLTLPNDAAISAVTVKLEGESRTRLAAPKFPHNERSDKKRTELELHKVGEKALCHTATCAHRQQLLYKVLTVFPTPELQGGGGGASAYTLLAGQYMYPFSFKVGLFLRNGCSIVAGANLGTSFPLTTTVKKTLRP